MSTKYQFVLIQSKKTDYSAKISHIDVKYFTTFVYNKFTSEILETKLKEKRLVDRSSIYNFVKNSGLNENLATLSTKGKLKAEQNEMAKHQAFYSSYFRSKSRLRMMARKVIDI